MRSLVVLGALLLSLPAVAADRSKAVDLLESIPLRDPARLKVWLNDIKTGPLNMVRNSVELGDNLLIHLTSSEDTHWLAIHLDANGIATLLGEPESRLVAEVEKIYPTEGGLTAKLPTGPFDIFVFATRDPVSTEGLLPPENGTVSSEKRTEALINGLENQLKGRPRGAVAAARIVGRVVGRSELRGLEATNAGSSTRGFAPSVTTEEIVEYFCCRGLAAGRLDTLVHFKINEATLDDLAKANLDQWGPALQDPSLKSLSFMVYGHADVRGEPQHNQSLSERRAEAVRDYLATKFGVEAAQLKVEAMGESVPLVAGDSEWAYAKNRRAEIGLAPRP